MGANEIEAQLMAKYFNACIYIYSLIESTETTESGEKMYNPTLYKINNNGEIIFDESVDGCNDENTIYLINIGNNHFDGLLPVPDDTLVTPFSTTSDGSSPSINMNNITDTFVPPPVTPSSATASTATASSATASSATKL